MKFALLCDFDGTIVTVDTGEYLLRKYVKEDWEIFGTSFEKGEITLEECIQRQLSMLTVPRQVMLEELERVTIIRSHFSDLVEYCGLRGVPFVIVSAGLDFVIQHFLQRASVAGPVEIHVPRSRFIGLYLNLTFPPLNDESSLDFKQDLVKDYQRQGYTVFYVGDGLSDYNAVRQAQYSFVIKGSKLAMLCHRERIPHQGIRDFQEVIDSMDSML